MDATQLSPSALSDLLAATIPIGYPVMIEGSPGIGKTDIVLDSARRAEADVILSHPAVADPTDAKGMPWIVDGHALFLPFGDLSRAIAATRRTVWFLDDLGQATPAVQASFMQLILARRVADHVLPDCITFIAATNRRTDRAGVSGILEPVKSRFTTIVELAVSLDDWCKWALVSNIQPELIAFLRFKPELLCKFEASADMGNSPIPRTWANASKLLQLGLSSSVLSSALAGAVGAGAAIELQAFLQMYATLPNIDAILLNPDQYQIPDEPSVLYALASALAHKSNPANFDRVAQFAQRLTDATHAEFAVLLVRDALQRDIKIAQTQAFVKLAVSELGQMISGNGGK
jgi:hypothetical protein